MNDEMFALPRGRLNVRDFDGVANGFEPKNVFSDRKIRGKGSIKARYVAPSGAMLNRLRALFKLSDLRADAAQSGQHGAVPIIDLDHFKTINDSLGHHVSDRVLEAIANSLLAATPTGSTVARLGGDEFVVLLGALAVDTDACAVRAVRVAENVLERLAAPLAIDNRILGIGANVGVAVFPNEQAQAADIIRCADIGLYRAKSAGCNAVRLFLPHI